MNENTGLLRRLWNRLFDQLVDDEGAAAPGIDRALSGQRLHDQLWEALWNMDMENDSFSWLIDVYFDNGAMFAIVAREGQLYRVGLQVENDTLVLDGEWMRVTEAFPPVQQSLSVRRQADGRHRWLMIAGTAVLNRVGEIDSTALFDSFVARAQESGAYPRLDFYHLGRSNPAAWEFGTADYLARDGVCYIASGLFDEDHPLAQAAIRALGGGDDKYGASIEFYAVGEPELVLAGNTLGAEVRIPVYYEGENTRISIVLEDDAAGLFTRAGSAQEVSRMREEIKESLRQFFGDEEEMGRFLTEFEVDVDRVNQRVRDDGLITRDQAATAGTGDDDGAGAEGEAGEGVVEITGELLETEEREIELDEEAMGAIVGEVLASEAISQISEQLGAVSAQLAELNVGLSAQLAEATRTIGELTQRVKELEREDGEKQREWLEDLPARDKVTVTYRPRHARNGDQAPGEGELGRIASNTVAKVATY